MVRWRFTFVAVLCFAVTLLGSEGFSQNAKSQLERHLKTVLPLPCDLSSMLAPPLIEIIPEEHSAADAIVRETLSELAEAPDADFLLAIEFDRRHPLNEGSVVSGLALTFQIAKLAIPRILAGKQNWSSLAFFLNRLSDVAPKPPESGETAQAWESWKAKQDSNSLHRIATAEGQKFFESWFQSYLNQAKLLNPAFPFGDGGSDQASLIRFRYWENGFWRSRAMTEGVLKSFCAARQSGKSVRVMMGASHVPIVYRFLSNSLKGHKVIIKTDRAKVERSLVKLEKASNSEFSFEYAAMRRLAKELP